jgi:meso-butanediol dehydrogenase / (S,S)-butanediol dehydrogenase / diacetyl reductase
MRLKERVAVVTGAGGGLGQGICLSLAREGARIVSSSLNLELAEDTAAKVRETGGKAIALQTDVRSKQACQALIDKSLKDMGKIDILVCCAGVAGIGQKPGSTKPLVLEQITEDELNLTIDVNIKGLFFCNQAIIPYFKERKEGKIINISSVGGRKGTEHDPVYSVTKAGVIVLTQSVALQLAHYNINVNTICPGIIWTPMWKTAATMFASQVPDFKGLEPEQVFGAVVKHMIPMGRPQMPEDVGNAVVFLSSDEAKEITGQALNVDGGSVFN